MYSHTQSRAKELPEVDDEFASDVSEKAETLDAYRAEVRGPDQRA